MRQRFDDCAKAAIASDTRFKIDEKFRYAALMQNRDLVEMVVEFPNLWAKSLQKIRIRGFCFN